MAADEPSLSTQLIQGGILMSHEDRPLQIERVNDRHYVIAKAICRAIRCRITGGTEPTPDNTVDMVVSRELRREVVENVSRIAAPASRMIGLPEPPQSSTSNRTCVQPLVSCLRLFCNVKSSF